MGSSSSRRARRDRPPVKFLVAIRCPSTQRQVSTGIITDIESLAGVPVGESQLQCPACGAVHVWSIKDAMLASTAVFDQPEA